MKYFFIILLILTCFSCKKNTGSIEVSDEIIGIESSVRYAQGFDLQIFQDISKLVIKRPYPNAQNQEVFYLVPRNNFIPDSLQNKNVIRTPIGSAVPTSTTHIPMIELFNMEDKIVGFPQTNYISSDRTTELVKTGKIAELGNIQNLNFEILVSLNPDLVIGFSMSENDPAFNRVKETHIPILFNGDWLEEEPLGRAEWLKVFGALFDKNQMADSIFNQIEKEYAEAKEIAQQSKDRPNVLSGILFEDKWSLPAGESFMAHLFADANINYLWKETKGTGSLVLALESVIEKGNASDLWIGAGIFTDYETMLESNSHYSTFNAFQEKKIFNFAKRKGDQGGILFFELAPIQPQVVLKDLIKAAHPDLLPDYIPYFLEPLD